MAADPRLNDYCLSHLEEALQADDAAAKDYHIRTVLQAYGVDEVPEELHG